MIETRDQLLDVIGEFYTAGLNEKSWRQALKNLTSSFDAVGANVFSIDLELGQIDDWTDYGLVAEGGEYAAHMHSVCPRVKHSWTRKTGEIFVDYDLITEQEMDNSEVYDWMRKTSDVRYFMGCRVSENGPRTTGASLEFSTKHGHVTSKDIENYNLILPHIRNARTIREQLQGAKNDAYFSAFMQSSVPWGVVGLDGLGDVLFANEKAEEIFLLHDGIEIKEKKLDVWQASAGRTLDELIASALISGTSAGWSAGGKLPVARASGKPAFAVQVMPVAGHALCARSNLAALVYIFDPVNGQMRGGDHLAILYGLTPTEAAFAVTLYNTCSLRKTADQMGIARNTARVHLTAVRTKTRTASQLELIKLLAILRPL